MPRRTSPDKVLEHLAAHPLNTDGLCEALEVSAYVIRKQLKDLRDRGLVGWRQQKAGSGYTRIYFLTDEGAAEAAGMKRYRPREASTREVAILITALEGFADQGSERAKEALAAFEFVGG